MTFQSTAPVFGRCSVSRTESGGVVVIGCAGELDVETYFLLGAEIERVPIGEPVVIDFTETSLMDSTGLQVLLRADAERPGLIHVQCAPACAVLDLLRLVGLAEMLDVHFTREEALAAAVRRPA